MSARITNWAEFHKSIGQVPVLQALKDEYQEEKKYLSEVFFFAMCISELSNHVHACILLCSSLEAVMDWMIRQWNW